MSVREVSGMVKMLGNARETNPNYFVYSLIEFADGTLVDTVAVSKRMDNFLRRSLKSEQPATLWLHKNKLQGLRVDDKVYVDRLGYVPPLQSYIFIAIGLGLSIYLVGIPIFWINWVNLNRAKAMIEIESSNPGATRI